MKLARELERRLEGLLDGLVGRVFRGPLHPTELASKLLRTADLERYETPAGPAVPNQYRIAVAPDDLGGEAVPGALVRELEVTLERTAADRGWRLEGPAAIVVEPSPEVRRGSIECHAESRPGPRETWADLRGDDILHLTYNRSILGRGSGCDVIILDPRTSRRHALVWRESGRVQVADLGSTNGTLVDGIAIGSAQPTILGAGSVITLGGPAYRFEPRG